MKTIKDFVGNEILIHKIVKWLEKRYHNPDEETPKYAILQGSSGNGKSYLGELLANTFRVELFRITPLDIESKDDLNNIIKSINMNTLEGKPYKLIFIDDIDEFSKQYRNKLFNIVEISKFPIIFTTKTFIDSDFYNFSKNGERFNLFKPYAKEIIEYIKDKLPFHYDKDRVEKIIKESKSFRSIELSLYNMQVNSLVSPLLTKNEWFSSINRRELKSNLSKDEIITLFDSIRGYDKNALKVMMKVAEFDYRVTAKYEKAKGESYPTIDKFFVNNMNAPIEKVMLKYQYKKNINNNSVKKVMKESKQKKKIKPKKISSSVDRWI